MLEETGFLDLLKEKADEHISVNRISYSGDNVYVYRTASGKVIRFNFTGYSPAEIHFMDEDDVE